MPPSEVLDAGDGERVRLTNEVSRYDTNGLHSVEAPLLGNAGSRQALEISYGYRLPFQCVAGGAFGGILLKDFEGGGTQLATLLTADEFSELYAQRRGTDAPQPIGALAAARQIVVEALSSLWTTGRLRNLMPWFGPGDMLGLLTMLLTGENLGNDAPQSQSAIRTLARDPR